MDILGFLVGLIFLSCVETCYRFRICIGFNIYCWLRMEMSSTMSFNDVKSGYKCSQIHKRFILHVNVCKWVGDVCVVCEVSIFSTGRWIEESAKVRFRHIAVHSSRFLLSHRSLWSYCGHKFFVTMNLGERDFNGI